MTGSIRRIDKVLNSKTVKKINKGGSMKNLTVNYFPYKPGSNPYQRLFADCLENSGITINRIAPKKIFPLYFASQGEPDFIHLDWPHDFYAGRNIFTRTLKTLMYYAGLKKIKNKKVVWTAHNLVAHNSEDIIREKKMIQKLIDVCDGIFLLSESSRKQLFDVYEINPKTIVEVSTLCHYIDSYKNTNSKSDAKRHFKNLRKHVFLHVGRIQPYKGTLNLLRQFNKLNDLDSTLIIAGKVDRDEFHKQILLEVEACRSRNLDVRFEDKFVKDDDFQIYFNAADFVVLPFEKILNSGSALLAMSFGKIIIAPNIGALSEVIPDFGWVSYEGDSNNLLSALKIALKHGEIDTIEHEIIEYTKRIFDWSYNGRKVQSLYRKIIDVNKKGG